MGKYGPVPFLHMLKGISGSPISAILRNYAGSQKVEDKAVPQGAKPSVAGTSGIAILICIYLHSVAPPLLSSLPLPRGGSRLWASAAQSEP